MKDERQRRENHITAVVIEQTQTSSIAVICTKDRPHEIEVSCAAAHLASPSMPLLVIDASTTDATRNICENISRRYGQSLRLIYRRARQPGLARQRNEAIGICRQMSVEIVHFIDDDTEVMPGYFDAIERRFLQEQDLMGLGGVILNQPQINFMTIKSIFMLVSRRRGSVLRSGRNMPGQYPGTQATDHVEWLNGCSMSFRIIVFDQLIFDDHLVGYSLGEDYDFTFRVSRKHRLAVEPSATCIHHMTSTMRYSIRTYGRQRTVSTHRWVTEHKHFGMSLAAFWWSTVGDLLLHIGYGTIHMERESFQNARGIIDGVAAIVSSRFRLSRGASPPGNEIDICQRTEKTVARRKSGRGCRQTDDH